jgi:acyl-CoA reductase-like NAD-dependent aldehyde dehydrogenase
MLSWTSRREPAQQHWPWLKKIPKLAHEIALSISKERAAQNKLGNPFEGDTFQGPQVSQLQFDRIMEYQQARTGAAALAVVEEDTKVGP